MAIVGQADHARDGHDKHQNATRNITTNAHPLNAPNAAPSGTNSGSSVCAKAKFKTLVANQLGKSPITIKSVVQGNQICIQFTLEGINTAGWFAVGFARQSAMVSSPPVDCMVYQRGQPAPVLYLIKGYAKSLVIPEQHQSSISTFNVSSTQAETLSFTIQRGLGASSESQVAIDYAMDSTLIWAYGSSWPISGHRSGTFGIESFNFATAKTISLGTGQFCDSTNCAAILGGATFLVMLMASVVLVTCTKNALAHTLLHRTLLPPPTKRVSNARHLWNPITILLATLSDVTYCHLSMAGAFVAAMVALLVASSNQSATSLIGRLAVLCMMFVFLPVSRVPLLWEYCFGGSFERIVKFHRWLGMLFVALLLVHLLLVIRNHVDLFDQNKFNDVVPLWGTVAALCFAVMALTALGPVRRAVFELFYYTHRVLSVVGVVFVLLHAEYSRMAMVVPLGLYALSLLWQWFKCFKYFGMDATLTSHSSGTVSITLRKSAKTEAIVKSMNPCAYFWVHCADVSRVQWHPFSAVVTAQRDSIGFVVKSTGYKSSFSHKLVQLAQTKAQTKVTLCGPFGHLGVHLNDYEVLVLVAGGVGITPLLSLLNHQVFGAPNEAHPTLKKKIFVVWSVREASDLLMIDDYCAVGGPVASTLSLSSDALQDGTRVCMQWMRHVSNSSGAIVDNDSTSVNGGHVPLSITRPSGDEISFVAGRPILDEVINSTRFIDKKVLVLACGPPTLVLEAQALARVCAFDFHKEVFGW